MSLAQVTGTAPRYKVWNEGMTFIGVYHDIRYYANGDKICCLFGWAPQTFDSVKQFQHAVRKRENEDDED